MESTKNDNLTRIREQLVKGRKITVLSVFNSIQTLEARHYIAILRKQGMAIKDYWNDKNGKRFKTWFIE